MKDNRSVHESLVMILQFGINMIVPIFACTWFGVFLAEKTGYKIIAVILFLAGAVAGMQNCYRLTKRMIAREQERKGSREIASELVAEARKRREAGADDADESKEE